MATQKVGRMEAQGNMDAYFENPNDWAFQKNAERNGAYKYDYATANTSPKQLGECIPPVVTMPCVIYFVSLLLRFAFLYARLNVASVFFRFSSRARQS
mmetsp:Transcript_26299/g.53392  ORF Transcript_26299/g.53392 Transcript_26299/m.53392 type:complete len:98 (-) Transcript_26299:3570-3863(-)